MAVVQLKDVEVVRVNQKGHGVQVVERWKAQGGDRSQRYTVWFDAEHGLREGDRIDVSGFLGAAVDVWTDREGEQRHTVKLSVNSPRMENHPAAAVAVPPEPWGDDAGIPF